LQQATALLALKAALFVGAVAKRFVLRCAASAQTEFAILGDDIAIPHGDFGLVAFDFAGPF
jgi:mannitol/fructose-specific phosphotransferase system IIA component